MSPRAKAYATAAWVAILFATSTALADPPPSQGAHHAPDNQTARFDEYVPGASRLDGRIRAPCCWNQTIDIHGSEVSQSLRREIRERLRAGESADAIEASIVTRYGDRVLAVPPGSPLKRVAVVLSVALLGAGVGAGALLLRWRRRSRPRPEGESQRAEGRTASELDERLDAELRALGD
jgi:cytochrome c-type biogenesis protein CcmH